MAILFLGKSKCHLCGRVLDAGDEIVSFTAFLKNTHPLGRYSESSMHRECFEASTDKDEVNRLYSRFKEIWAQRPKTLEEAEEWAKTAFKELE